MGILDGIVEWIAEQIMYGLDLINTSVLGALGCDMSVFLRYFPAAETMYESLVALAIGLILLLWVWNLFKNFGLGTGSEAEDPIKLSIRSVLFILLAYYSNQIVDIALTIGGTPYSWIMTASLPSLDFASFNSVLLTIIGVCANGGVALIVLILLLVLAWNYLKLLCEAAERYVLLGVLVFTAPVAFAMGASQATSNIFIGHERLVLAAVRQHGRCVYRKSTISVKEGSKRKREYSSRCCWYPYWRLFYASRPSPSQRPRWRRRWRPPVSQRLPGMC